MKYAIKCWVVVWLAAIAGGRVGTDASDTPKPTDIVQWVCTCTATFVYDVHHDKPTQMLPYPLPIPPEQQCTRADHGPFDWIRYDAGGEAGPCLDETQLLNDLKVRRDLSPDPMNGHWVDVRCSCRAGADPCMTACRRPYPI